MLFTQ